MSYDVPKYTALRGLMNSQVIARDDDLDKLFAKLGCDRYVIIVQALNEEDYKKFVNWQENSGEKMR